MKKIILLVLLSIVTAEYNLAGDSIGKVQKIVVHDGDVVIFTAGIHNDKPACSTQLETWALSLKTAKGKSMYAMLLSAAAQGHTVHTVGQNACNAWGDRESPLSMWIDF